MDVEVYIRQSAARGLSRRAVAGALGISYRKLRDMLDSMPPVEWPGPGRSVDFLRAHAARRGQPSEVARRALQRAHAIRRQRASHAVRGRTGTLAELVAAFGVEVSASTVRRRLQEGMTLEQALFTPRQPWCRPNQRQCAFARGRL